MIMRENKALKIASYILLPILILIIIISIFYTFAKESFLEYDEEYFKSIAFSYSYMDLLGEIASSTIFMDNNYDYISEDNYRIYSVDIEDYNFYNTIKNHYILMIYKDKAVTNVNTYEYTTIEEIKSFIEEQERRKSEFYKWKCICNFVSSEIYLITLTYLQ